MARPDYGQALGRLIAARDRLNDQISSMAETPAYRPGLDVKNVDAMRMIRVNEPPVTTWREIARENQAHLAYIFSQQASRHIQHAAVR